MKKKVVIVLLIVIVALMIVGPAFASLLWEHKWDAVHVRVDRLVGDPKVHVYGRNSYVAIQGTLVKYDYLSCAGALSPRVDVAVPTPGGATDMLIVKQICAQMTPTPAPTANP